MAEKIRIGMPENPLPFMPSADKFLAYLGMPGGIASVVNKLGNRPDRPPLIDPKTVRKAFREGVSPNSFTQIKGLLDSVVPPEMYDYITSPYLLPWMETTLRQNGLSWLAIAKGARLNFSQAARPETFTELFIKQRAEQEMRLLQTGQEIQKSDSSSAVFDERWRQTLHDFFLQHTKVDPLLVDRGLQAWAALKSRVDQPHKEQVGLLFGLYTRLRIDFYYQLLCNLSLDLIQWFKEIDGTGKHEQWLIENSLFGEMVPTSDGRNLTLPFGQLIDVWRKNAAPGGGALSLAKIAQRLPNPQGIDPEKQSLAPGQTRDDRKAAINKNKRSRLREWRQGTRPQPEQLEQFVKNLVPDGSDVSSLIMIANIACSWGAFILDELALFEDYNLTDARQETLPAFGLYPAYWVEYKVQAAQIVAA